MTTIIKGINSDYPEFINLNEAEHVRASMTLQEAEEEAYFQNSLLPCPFCGGRAEAVVIRNPELSHNGKVLSVHCTGCGNALYFSGILIPERAREMWNTRASMPESASHAAVSGDSKAASHYQLLSQQPIEIMQTLFSADEFRGFLWGNVIKYALRYGHKDERRKEAEKIAQYAEWLTRAERGERIVP